MKKTVVGSNEKFRKSMGLDIKHKPAELGPISDAISAVGEEKRLSKTVKKKTRD